MSQYNESEKILLLHQYVRSDLTLRDFSSRHGIPLSTFHRIYTEYGSPDVSSVAYLMKKKISPLISKNSKRSYYASARLMQKKSNVLRKNWPLKNFMVWPTRR